jgi:tetratricopeptide (TPR) repeat protein
MRKLQEIAALEGPYPAHDPHPIALAAFRSQYQAEQGEFEEAAKTLSVVMPELTARQIDSTLKQMFQTRIDILKKWDASKRVELKDYRTFFLDTGPQWFHDRARPIAALWTKELGSQVDRYVLIAALLKAKRDTNGQVIALSAIPDIPGAERFSAADALLNVGNVLSESSDSRGAEGNWLRVMESYPKTPAWPDAVLRLGLLYKQGKRFPEAIAACKELLETAPNDKWPGGRFLVASRNHECAMVLSECYEALGDFPKALDYARAASTKYPYISACGMGGQEESRRLQERVRYLENKVREQGAATKNTPPLH